MFLLCKLNKFVCIVAAMYVPPPFSSDPLKKLAQFMALYPNIPVLARGDFNNVIDPHLDRLSLTPRSVNHATGKTIFASLLSDLRLRNVWQETHPMAKCYSCYSASHGGLSCIDLGLGNVILMQRVISAACEPRLLSDHSPFWVRIDVVAQETRPLLQTNPFWLTLLPSLDGISSTLVEFLRLNRLRDGCCCVGLSQGIPEGMSHSRDNVFFKWMSGE